MLREKMEILTFALIASYNAHRQQEWVVAEPEEFQFLDLQALRNSTKNKPIRSWSRREVYLPQTVFTALPPTWFPRSRISTFRLDPHANLSAKRLPADPAPAIK
jgi:hypothetical protein